MRKRAAAVCRRCRSPLIIVVGCRSVSGHCGLRMLQLNMRGWIDVDVE
jgi:hypothetical protein